MSEIAVSSPSRRAFEAITNCSTQLFSRRPMTSSDDVHWENTDGGCQKRNTSLLMYISDGLYSSSTCSDDLKMGCTACGWGMEGCMSDRVC